ncbi:MAG: hypothetical protein JU82_08780 [Sulfuricurvum sp. MLSB]|nr:MAG: hypothetical protein JU82_08780 [Sulfuricurvum sp. MLSB]
MSIRAKVKYYNWCVALGIDLRNFDPHRIDFGKLIKKSSFKNRSQEIKEKYNYKFDKNETN